jgi:hypothetical protein
MHASFIHLSNANDRVLQARDLIYARQGLVLAVAPGEDDGAFATDVDDGAVSELDVTLHCLVKLREHIAVARHVVHRAHVEVPALEVIIVAAAHAEERLSLGLI